MNPICLDYCLTGEESEKFEEDGYFIVEDVLSPDQTERLSAATDRIDAEHRAPRGVGPYARLSVRDFIGMDEAFMELVDWYKVFPKVWGILGWNRAKSPLSPPIEQNATHWPLTVTLSRSARYP